MRFRRTLPPLTALTAFEAAARLTSFTKAAEELGVTQAAVSRQIYLLEQELGFPLFMRLHRRIELTERGRMLSTSTADAFTLIARTVADITRDSFGSDLTISATVAFSQLWLLPRIPEFSRQHPEINLRIVTQNSIPSIESGELDVAIRFGNGMWPDGQAELLFEDEIFPICSPAYANAAERIDKPQDLVGHPLISSDIGDPTWTGWSEWLAAFSVMVPKKAPGFRCSYYTEAIYAALNGQGIALGWRRLVEDLLLQKRLVRLTDATVTTRNAYFIVVPTKQRRSESTNLFLDWLKTASQRPSLQSAAGSASQLAEAFSHGA